MWRNPNYPELPQGPPQEQGERLATFVRGPGQEMRVTRSEYEGHEYISLRLWERNRAGDWWPTRKGCSVRFGEAGELARVLTEVAADAPDPAPQRQPARQGPGTRRRPSGGEWAEEHRPASTPEANFDEFGE